MRVSTLHDFHTQAVAKAMLPSDKPRLTATTPPAFEVDASKVEEAFDAAYEASIGAKGNLGQKGDPSVSTVLVVALDKSILRPGESADFTYRYELLSYDTVIRILLEYSVVVPGAVDRDTSIHLLPQTRTHPSNARMDHYRSGLDRIAV